MSNNQLTTTELLNILLDTQPRFHGREQAGSKNYAIAPPVLKWIVDNIKKGARTLETGCGYSTVVLTSLAEHHTVISPFSEEHTLIKRWCEGISMKTEHTSFIAATSQVAMPEIDVHDLDLVLIDGDHAFPAPFIDWYYSADHVVKGGYVIVDDTQIPTGAILRDFLNKESSRWRKVQNIGKSTIFQRITDEPVATGIIWNQQPFCNIPLTSKLSRFAAKLRGQ